MAKTVLIDELHLTVRVPAGMADADREAVRRVLAGDAFVRRLRHAVRRVVRAFPDLAATRVSVTR